MRDDYARREITFLSDKVERHFALLMDRANKKQIEALQKEVNALRKAFNDVMELVVAKTHLVNFDHHFGGPHTLDVQRSAVEMIQS